jgi:hypothetical protein
MTKQQQQQKQRADAYPELVAALRVWDRATTEAKMQAAFQAGQLLLRKLGEEP